MRYLKVISFLTLWIFLAGTLITYAQMTPARDVEKEKIIWNELEEKSAESVEKFKTATENLDKNSHEEAVKLYKEVLEKVPEFDHALRRSAYSLSALNRRAEALENASKAVEIRRTPENLVGYASIILSYANEQYKPNKTEKEQALKLSKEALKKDKNNEPDYALMVAQLSLEADDIDEFEKAVSILNEKHPNEMGTHYFSAINKANYGYFDEAEVSLKKAEEAGMPKEATEQLSAAIDRAKSESYYGWEKYLYIALALIGLWILGLAVLFIGGKILSNKTLHSIENSSPNDITGKAQAGLKSIYRKIILIAGVYYYISQPILILLIIGLTAGIIFMFILIGTIPIKIVLVLGIVALASVFYMIKSLVIRTKIEDPGRALREEEAPELFTLVRNVAETLETRPVDEIRITPGAELAVYERGSIRAKMQDKAERILIIGLASLKGFDKNAFRAVLAHEYGHFSNRDTAGGDIAFHVNNDIMKFAESMALSGTATFYNIAFQFLRFYHFLFRRITHGASRLQEILADRVAVYQYGGEAFREGLKHVIRRELEFSHLAEREISAAHASNRAIQNLYELKLDDEMTQNDVAHAYKESMELETTEDDTHPSPKDRFRLSEKINPKEITPLEGRVWDMFVNKDELTKEMNANIEASLYQHAYE